MGVNTVEEQPTRPQCAVSPVAPSTPPRHAVASGRQRRPANHKQPWVAACWKHRVPEHCSKQVRVTDASCLLTEAQASIMAEQKKRVAADFAAAHDTIDRMLARCKHVQDTLPPSQTHSTAATTHNNSSSSSKGVLHMTMRSQLLFESPHSATCSTCNASKSISGGRNSSGTAPAAAGSFDHNHHHHQQQQQHHHHDAWDGAVDLNPGFSFRPGSPQRAKATFRRAMQQPLSAAGACTAVAAASIGGPMTDMVAAAPVPKAAGAAVVPVCDAVQLSGPRLCGLTHREVLQAGIQELTGAFYHKLRQQQWQQHQVQQQQFGRHAAAVPLSWFGVC